MTLGIALIALLLTVPFAGLTDFNTKGEPREAIVAYSMLESGNWILPENNGGDFAYKPPLFHWCIAIASSIYGEVTEFTARIPSVLSLVIITILTFLFFSKQDKTTAFIAAIITLTNFETLRAGMNCRVDMLLTMFIVSALFSLYNWRESKHSTTWLALAIICMSGGTLTKGPVAIILPCGVVACYMLLRGENFFRTFFQLFAVAIAACLIPMLWYYAAYLQKGDLFLSLAIEENFGRFLGKMSYESHENPFYYNFITLISGMLPYTLLILIVLFFTTWRKPDCGIIESCRNQWYKFKHTDNIRLYSLLSILVIFIFYCIPASKRSVYLLPIYPFIAYFISEMIIKFCSSNPRPIKIFGWIITSLAILTTIIFTIIRSGLLPESITRNQYLEALANNEIGLIGLATIILPILTVTYFIYMWHRDKTSILIFPTLINITILFLSFHAFYQPTILNTKSDKKVALTLNKLTDGGIIYSYIPDKYLRYYVLNFYLDNRIIPINPYPISPAVENSNAPAAEDIKHNISKALTDKGYIFLLTGEKVYHNDKLLLNVIQHFDHRVIWQNKRKSNDTRQPTLLIRITNKCHLTECSRSQSVVKINNRTK